MKLVPGDVVVTDFGLYQHWSLVSDRRDAYGQYMLISASRRTGTVREEPFDRVTAGNPSYVAHHFYDKPLWEVLADARWQIDRWDYSLTGNNCEHFIHWATGHRVRSSQVQASVLGTVAGVAFTTFLGPKYRVAKLIGSAVIAGGSALMASKARKHR